MSDRLSLTADADADGERLDRFLANRCPDLSRSRVQQLISEGQVTLEGRLPKPSSKVQVGQLVTVAMPDPVSTPVIPQDIPLKVAYQDRDILVVDKPAGLTVHPAPGHPDTTLVNAVLALCPDLQGIGASVRPGIVHRLDKDSSGLMVVAKSGEAHADLSRQLRRRGFTKVYLVLVHGRLSPAEARIEAPIGRDPRQSEANGRGFKWTEGGDSLPGSQTLPEIHASRSEACHGTYAPGARPLRVDRASAGGGRHLRKATFHAATPLSSCPAPGLPASVNRRIRGVQVRATR